MIFKVVLKKDEQETDEILFEKEVNKREDFTSKEMETLSAYGSLPAVSWLFEANDGISVDDLTSFDDIFEINHMIKQFTMTIKELKR